MVKRVAIVGGGPSGVYCALLLCSLGDAFEITIFEKDSPLKTLLPTGGGRCNITYNEPDFREFAKNYPRGEKFLYSVFSRYFLNQTRDFFDSIGVKTYVQEDLRVFPTSNSSKDVVFAMLKKLKSYNNVKIVKKEVKSIEELVPYDKVVISTGSKGGYDLAKAYGHTITPLAAALCGYVTKQKFPPGVVLNNILFTHQGISGPWVYKYSSLNAYKELPFKIEIPLIDPQKLREAILKDSKKTFLNVLSQFVPKALASCLTQNGELQACHIKKGEINALSLLILDVVSVDNKGETVKAGGVSLREINSSCRSKLDDRVYFCGEILDIDGFCGGFNLQNCWSTAAVAAFDIASQNT